MREYTVAAWVVKQFGKFASFNLFQHWTGKITCCQNDAVVVSWLFYVEFCGVLQISLNSLQIDFHSLIWHGSENVTRRERVIWSKTKTGSCFFFFESRVFYVYFRFRFPYLLTNDSSFYLAANSISRVCQFIFIASCCN